VRDLVLARVGSSSLHRCWIDPGTPRDWDLRLVPYQAIPSQEGVDCVVGEVIPGPKWTGLRELLNQWDGWRDYDHVWLPDDDLLVDQGRITQMFQIARTAGLDLFAPALHDASHFVHFSTMQNHSFFGRRTGFVEIMMPGVQRVRPGRAPADARPERDRLGMGLDSLWPKRLGYRNVGIIDAVPVLHTRPVGQMRDLDLARRVHEESDRIMTDNKCHQVQTCFSAFGPDGATVSCAPEQFFADLVKGWQHLIDVDPRILTWLVDYQVARRPGLPYPVEGTP
jgi:hypothetical protein